MATITGTNNADNLVGTAGNDVISGLGGNDTLTGGAGLDQVNGGNGNDRLIITEQAEVAVGETYTGGSGFDTLDLETANAVNLSAVTISADLEALESNGAVALTAAQLGAFTSVNTGTITLTAAGTADLTGATVFTNTFNLNAAGNTLDLSEVLSNAFTVNGAGGADTIRGGELGDTLNGGGGNDTLRGGGGNDTLTGGTGTDTFDYQATTLNTLDVGAGAVDTVANGVGDRINFTAGLEGQLRVNGTTLSGLAANTALGATFNAGTNIRFVGGNLEIDLNGDQAFNGGDDFRISLAGVSTVTYNAALDLLQLS